jgi:imidazolonepropionase-like amidohydrolase
MRNLVQQIIITIVITLLILAGCKRTTEYDIVISNIHLFNGEDNLGIVNIAINQDTIAAINSEPMKAKQNIDGTGLYAIPGLVNGHSHAWLPEHLKEAFEAGILASFNLYQIERSEMTLKTYYDSLGYSNWHTSSYAATVAGGHASQMYPHPNYYPFISDSLTEKDFVDYALSEGGELIKIIRNPIRYTDGKMIPWPSLTLEQIKKIIDYANSKDVKTLVHILTLEDAIKTVKLKPSGLAHMWHDRTPPTEEDMRAIKKSGMFIIPTMLLEINSNARLNEDTTISEEALAFESSYFMYPDSVIFARVKQVHDFDIPIVAGNDSPNKGINFGSDLIEELKIYESAGIPKIDILKTATGNAAKYLPTEGVGRVIVGGPASFLILNEDPIEDLDALNNIAEIWKNGERAITIAKNQ